MKNKLMDGEIVEKVPKYPTIRSPLIILGEHDKRMRTFYSQTWDSHCWQEAKQKQQKSKPWKKCKTYCFCYKEVTMYNTCYNTQLLQD